jgi:hypothetical protein
MENKTLVLIVGGVIVLVIIAIYVAWLYFGAKNIFKRSGSPIAMAQTLLSSIHVTIQHLLGILIIVLICLLMMDKVISSEAGLPLLSAVSGYLLAKTFKDVNISPTKKDKKDKEV